MWDATRAGGRYAEKRMATLFFFLERHRGKEDPIDKVPAPTQEARQPPNYLVNKGPAAWMGGCASWWAWMEVLIRDTAISVRLARWPGRGLDVL